MDDISCSFLHDYRAAQSPLFPANSPLRQTLLFMIQKRGVRHFFSDMEPGFPTQAAQLVLALREDYPITLECVLPYEEQAKFWSESDRTLYFLVLEHCDTETMLQRSYTPTCQNACRRHLIRHSRWILSNTGLFSQQVHPHPLVFL